MDLARRFTVVRRAGGCVPVRVAPHTTGRLAPAQSPVERGFPVLIARRAGGKYLPYNPLRNWKAVVPSCMSWGPEMMV